MKLGNFPRQLMHVTRTLSLLLLASGHIVLGQRQLEEQVKNKYTQVIAGSTR